MSWNLWSNTPGSPFKDKKDYILGKGLKLLKARVRLWRFFLRGRGVFHRRLFSRRSSKLRVQEKRVWAIKGFLPFAVDLTTNLSRLSGCYVEERSLGTGSHWWQLPPSWKPFDPTIEEGRQFSENNNTYTSYEYKPLSGEAEKCSHFLEVPQKIKFTRRIWKWRLFSISHPSINSTKDKFRL